MNIKNIVHKEPTEIECRLFGCPFKNSNDEPDILKGNNDCIFNLL